MIPAAGSGGYPAGPAPHGIASHHAEPQAVVSLEEPSRISRTIDRRAFLGTAASLTALGPTAAHLAAGEQAGPLYRISLAQWSLHRRLFGRQAPELGNLDFPGKARELGFDAVEWVNQFFKDKARDGKYLAEMVRRADGEGGRNLLIMCDGEERQVHRIDVSGIVG